jgi:hypothetical protein
MPCAEGGTSGGEATIDSWEKAAEGAAAVLPSCQAWIYQLGFNPKEGRSLLMILGAAREWRGLGGFGGFGGRSLPERGF